MPIVVLCGFSPCFFFLQVSLYGLFYHILSSLFQHVTWQWRKSATMGPALTIMYHVVSKSLVFSVLNKFVSSKTNFWVHGVYVKLDCIHLDRLSWIFIYANLTYINLCKLGQHIWSLKKIMSHLSHQSTISSITRGSERRWNYDE